MIKKRLLATVLLTVLLISPSAVLPFETDQFNLPPVPLADVGDEVSEYVEAQLRIVVDGVNADIDRREKCLEAQTKGCDSSEKEREKLSKLRSHLGLAEAFYECIAGGNLMTTKFGKWMNSHKFHSQPARYKAPYSESIYVLNPFNYATLSPTVRLYGHEFGIDKLEHLFQQGYRYFKIYTEAVTKGSSPDEATIKAIKWGQKTERTYYGLWTSGVYSNADLFANYVGLKFYIGLTESQEIDKSVRPPSVRLLNGRWTVTASRDSLLRPFVSAHMNEALNPSSFRPTLVRSVRRSVQKYACPEWQKLFLAGFVENPRKPTESLQRWNTEDYGHTKLNRSVGIATTCFLSRAIESP